MNYNKIYDSIISRAKLDRELTYKEKHHIIPKCLGGTDDKENLVDLTPEEHFVCHILLIKMYPTQSKLVYALNNMCRGHEGRRSRKMYGWLKRRFSEVIRESQTGVKNSQFGTRWVNNGTTRLKIKSTDQIPEGFSLGRYKKKRTSGAYGTRWINNGVSNKLIINTSELPDGYEFGRIMNMKGLIPFKNSA